MKITKDILNETDTIQIVYNTNELPYTSGSLAFKMTSADLKNQGFSLKTIEGKKNLFIRHDYSSSRGVKVGDTIISHFGQICEVTEITNKRRMKPILAKDKSNDKIQYFTRNQVIIVK